MLIVPALAMEHSEQNMDPKHQHCSTPDPVLPVCSKERSRLTKFKPAATMRVLQLDWRKLTSWKYCGNCCWKDNKRINCSFSEPFTFQSKCLMYFLFSSSLNSEIPLSITVHSSKACHKKLIILHGKVLLYMRAGCCSLFSSSIPSQAVILQARAKSRA